MDKSIKRNQILATSKDLFYKHGSKRVTIEEICSTAGVSKVTYYKYFKNKNDLIRTIGEELIDIGFGQFDEISMLDIPFTEKIQKMTEWKMDFFSKIKTDFIADVISMETIIELAKKKYLLNIARAQEKGEIRDDLSPELIWLVTDKMNELIKDGSWKTVFDDYRTFQKQMRNLFFFGMLTRSGIPDEGQEVE
jgi:AcrR family transcriptional regulator